MSSRSTGLLLAIQQLTVTLALRNPLLLVPKGLQSVMLLCFDGLIAWGASLAAASMIEYLHD